MKRAYLLIILICTAVFIAVSVAQLLALQEKPVGAKDEKAAGEKEGRWQGKVVRSDTEKSTLTVAKGNIEKTIVYSSSTKWTTTKGSKATDASQFTEGSQIACVGKFDDKGRLHARTCQMSGPPRYP